MKRKNIINGIFNIVGIGLSIAGVTVHLKESETCTDTTERFCHRLRIIVYTILGGVYLKNLADLLLMPAPEEEKEETAETE